MAAYVTRIRREIHRHPELSGRETRTTALVARELRALGMACRPGVAQILQGGPRVGVIATLGRGHDGGAVALRADMDALPVQEAAGRPYGSAVGGVMHACGHDAHVACLLGAAKILSKDPPLRGAVRFIFQPAEETAGGAQKMILAGALSNPRVKAVVGLHVNALQPAGTIGVREGPFFAAVDQFECVIRAAGGHGAYPHTGGDAVVAAAEVVQALQTVVSRRVDPLEPVVVSVGAIHGGTAFNVLADRVTLTGTVRTLSPAWRRRVRREMESVVAGTCRAAGARPAWRWEALSDPLVNDAKVTAIAAGAAERIVGARRVLRVARPSMGGEDFADYCARVPGCFLFLGVGNRRRGIVHHWHTGQFDIDESALVVGARVLAEAARTALSQ